MAIDWGLSSCCNTGQIVFLGLFGGYLVLNLLLWRVPILRPMKLIAVFAHEMSHALACWMSGGRVKEIQVFDNEGGVTKYTGGVQSLIIPAGYLGCAFWGMVFVVLSADVIAATVSACIFIFALLFSLIFKPSCTSIGLNLGFAVLTLGCVLLQWLIPGGLFIGNVPFIGLVTLYYGVFIGSFSIYDIYDDLITRTVEGSDAHACYQLYPCCLPRCVGVLWAIIALAFMGVGVYLALVWTGAA
mmetsp:Transcript_12210/g.30819  ORF Transcript_12210/g.30819 Transcript_12210/m.30819 type:complete len:243 (-) Transcript_12210:74-802(-)|eukprot:jgi/Tetstr1/428641/TSEL_018629.t1